MRMIFILYIIPLLIYIKNLAIPDNDSQKHSCLQLHPYPQLDSNNTFILFLCTEREAPPVLYTNPPPLSPPDDFKQISETDNELFGKKYNYRFEDGNRKNTQWRKSGRGKDSFDANQLNTYSPFFQNEDLDDIDKDGMYSF